MRIPEILASEDPCFSFEFFPPKTADGEEQLFGAVDELKELEPDFVSVTYGAAGSTREGTIETCERIVREAELETMAHLSCVGETIQGIESILGRLEGIGVDNVLALRGDPPVGEPNFTPPEGGLRSSPELAAYIRARGEHWGIGGSAFPEIHPEAATPDADIEFLARKVDAGAEFLITQLFFDNSVFFEWLERVRAFGIEVPVIAGLMPIISYERTKRLCKVCEAGFPSQLEGELKALDGDAEREREFGVEFAIEQSRELLAGGAAGLHFYTLNRAPATHAVLSELKR